MGEVVEVDATKIGSRKYHRGRVVDGTWVFGLVQRGSGRFRLEVCPDNKRNKKTMLGRIIKLCFDFFFFDPLVLR